MRFAVQRRVFIRSLVRLIQAGMAAAVLIPGFKFLRGATVRQPEPDGDNPTSDGPAPPPSSPYIRVAALSSLSLGQPTRVVVIADRWDAFTHYPSNPIGSVWLIRTEHRAAPSEIEQASHTNITIEEASTEVRCLQTICPHLGCGIDLAVASNSTGVADTDRNGFNCPCHVSDFDGAGRRVSGPSPRDMDQLSCRITAADESGERWVEIQYVEFRTGAPDKRPIA